MCDVKSPVQFILFLTRPEDFPELKNEQNDPKIW